MNPFAPKSNKQWLRRQGRLHMWSLGHAARTSLFSVGLLVLGSSMLLGGQSHPGGLKPSTARLELPAEDGRPTSSSPTTSARLAPSGVAPGWLYVVDPNNGKRESEILVVDPSEGRVVRSFKTDSRPEIALSPDGARLYIASTRYSEDGNSSEGFLMVVNTKNGNVLSRVTNPDRWLPTVPTSSSMMKLSTDGRWLYFFKHVDTREADTYYVATFDTKKNRFLTERIMLPGCVTARLVPVESRGQLAVACDGTRDVQFVKLSGKGAITGTKNIGSEAILSRISLSSRGLSEPGRRMASILPSPDGATLTVIMGDGRYLKVDTQSHLVIQTAVIDAQARRAAPAGLTSASSEQADWLADSWIRWQTPATSPDNKKFYLGIGRLVQLRSGVQSFDRVMVFDSQSLGRLASIRTSQPFESFALSADGGHLYAISPEQAAIMVIDTVAQREVRSIYGVGTSPISALVAP